MYMYAYCYHIVTLHPVIPTLTHYSNTQFLTDHPEVSMAYIYILTIYLTFFWHILLNITFYLAFYLASILTYFLASTASKACDMEFGFRRSPLHPELAIWRR